MKFILPKINIKIERWKWSEKFQVYVSNMGNFKDKNKKDIRLKVGQSGYMQIKTPNNGYRSVHRVVLETWKPNEDAELLTVDHLNHNKRDNSIWNLEWVSKEENLSRARQDFFNDSTLIEHERNKNDIFIKNNTVHFYSYERAVQWLLDRNAFGKTIPKKDLIIKRIETKVQSKVKYCGYFWKYEEEAAL